MRRLGVGWVSSCNSLFGAPDQQEQEALVLFRGEQSHSSSHWIQSSVVIHRIRVLHVVVVSSITQGDKGDSAWPRNGQLWRLWRLQSIEACFVGLEE